MVKEEKMKRSTFKAVILVYSVAIAFFVTIVLRLFIEEGTMLLSILTILAAWAAAAVAVIFFFSKEEKLQQLNEKREKIFLGVIKVLWALAGGFCLTLIVIGIIHLSIFLRVLLLGLIWIPIVVQILIELKKIRQK